MKPRSRPAQLGLLTVVLLLTASSCRRRVTELPADAAADGPAPVRIIYPSAPGSFVKLVSQAQRSLVHIRTNVPVRDGPADWFPSAVLPGADSEEWVARLQRALGSGFIADRQGHIVTNAHIVGEKRPIWVQLHDGTTLKAKIVGRDVKTDVALLKVTPPPNVTLRPLRFGRAAQLEVGEWVIALGNPFGLGHRVNAGIVSALPRIEAPGARFGKFSYLQVDIDINQGNSGGPLLNNVGEVVGLNTTTEANIAGVGFALPMELVIRLLPALKRDGEIVRAWVGWYIVALEAEQMRQAKLGKGETGALITRIFPRGPAARAGVRQGDILLSFNKQPVRNVSNLPWMAAMAGVDRPVPVVVWRGGKRLTFELRTERMPQ